MEHIYKIQNKKENAEYPAKVRVVNSKYNSLGVTIPKEIVNSIGLNKGDLMKFKVIPETDNNIKIDICFEMQK